MVCRLTVVRLGVLAALALLCAACATREKTGVAPGAAAKGAEASGYVSLDAEHFTAELVRQGKPVTVEGDARTPAKVSPGQYTLRSCTIQKKGPDGTAWTITGVSMEPVIVAAVEPGQTVPLKVGPPLKASVRADRAADAVNFTLGPLQGQAGEYYQAAGILHGSTPTSAPGVQVLDSGGRTIAEGKFRYG